jgi:phage shock protein PspC (stress-responsive transcriptional regulator)
MAPSTRSARWTPARDPEPEEADPRPRPRRLRRIREGQQLAGVCNGLADCAELRVDWVRTLFLLGTVVTGGILGLVYIALAFILPVSATRET